MSEQCQDTVRTDPQSARQTMSIHTRKITDSCRDKDCIEDLPVYLTTSSQEILNSATGVRARSAELISTYIDVEPVAFDRNHYCVDITFYYRVLADALSSASRPTTLYGLAVFSKRAVLCGEDSRAHIYRSDTRINAPDGLSRLYANRPTAVVEVLDPMVLSSGVREGSEEGARECVNVQVPDAVRELFDEDLVFCTDQRRMNVTLGQFSIVRLERDAQIVVPILDYSIPTRECCDNPGCAEDPCEMFNRIPFPSAQFTPRGCDGCACRDERRADTAQ